MYEGYAPGGVAVLVECLTDNKNRAASDVRTAVTRSGGSMGDPGSVAYLFTRKGVVTVPHSAVIDSGVDDEEGDQDDDDGDDGDDDGGGDDDGSGF